MGKGLSKVSIQFLRDSEGTLVGALVLYIELTPFVALSSHIDNLLHFDVTNIDEIQPVQPPAPTEEPTLELIDKMVSEFSDAPDRLTPDEKTELLLTCTIPACWSERRRGKNRTGASYVRTEYLPVCGKGQTGQRRVRSRIWKNKSIPLRELSREKPSISGVFGSGSSMPAGRHSFPTAFWHFMLCW